MRLSMSQDQTKNADLLQREAAILQIKAIETRYGLQTCLVNKQERHLLEQVRQRPDILRLLSPATMNN